MRYIHIYIVHPSFAVIKALRDYMNNIIIIWMIRNNNFPKKAIAISLVCFKTKSWLVGNDSFEMFIVDYLMRSLSILLTTILSNKT